MARVALLTPNLLGMKDGINRIQPSLGVGYLAGVLRQRGHEVYTRDTALEDHNRIIVNADCKTITIGESEGKTAAWLSDVNPDYIGISVLFSNLLAHGHEIARIAKQAVPRARIIIGGNHITNSASDYIYFKGQGLEARMSDLEEDKNIDFGMRGEVDFDFADLVDVLSQGRDPTKIPGLIYRSNNGIAINQTSGRLGRMDDLPFPARDIMNMEGYFKIGLFHSAKPRSNRVGNVMASRGCPEKCTFCTTPDTWGATVRWRSPENVASEIRQLVEIYHIGEVQFEDDTLTANRRNLERLCDLMEPIGIYWCTPNGTKINYHSGVPDAQFQMFKRMKDSGCYQITFAVESGDQKVLDNIIQKRLPLDCVNPTIERAKKAGLMVHTFWVVGSIGETREEMERTIEFAEKCGADSYSVSILTPLPGTPQYRQAVARNLCWGGTFDPKEMIYRNSLIKVDGFSTPEEAEAWVNERNRYLNSMLSQRDPERFRILYGEKSGARMLMKQT